MRISVDPRADALYLKLREGAVHETRPLLDLRVIADFDEHGELLGVEVLGVDVQLDEFGYAHLDVAITTSEGRVINVDPEQLRAAEAAGRRT